MGKIRMSAKCNHCEIRCKYLTLYIVKVNKESFLKNDGPNTGYVTKYTDRNIHLVFPLKLSPHLPELWISTSSRYNVVHNVDMNVIQHNTVTVSCTSRDVIHCRKTAAKKHKTNWQKRQIHSEWRDVINVGNLKKLAPIDSSFSVTRVF